MITTNDLKMFPDDDEIQLKLATKEGLYLLACIFDNLDPYQDYQIVNDPDKQDYFSIGNQYVHLYRRLNKTK